MRTQQPLEVHPSHFRYAQRQVTLAELANDEESAREWRGILVELHKLANPTPLPVLLEKLKKRRGVSRRIRRRPMTFLRPHVAGQGNHSRQRRSGVRRTRTRTQRGRSRSSGKPGESEPPSSEGGRR